MKFFILFFLSGFLLILSAKDYKGAEYRTKAAFLYGRFEVSYKAPQRDGVLASFFTYYDGGGGSATWNEIDIEILGRYSDDVQFNTITPGEQHHVRHQGVKFNPAQDFNTYAFEWTPDYVAWFINGEEVYRQTGSHIQTLNRSQKLMMNIWNPQYENWAGVFNPETLPAFAYYDWVKYYSYTPGTGGSGTGNNFSLQWTDNFDSFNTDRWAKATHTWTGNLCDFITNNVVFKDGKMILCLTDAINVGYQDLKAPLILNARASSGKVSVDFSEELDSLSSQVIANYILPGYTIESAVLKPDRKSVVLNIPGLNLTQSTNLLVLNVKDTFGNKMVTKAVSVIPIQQFVFPLRINVGGSTAYQDFITDQQFSPVNDFGYLDGTSGSYGSPQINGTEDDVVYSTDRFGLTKYSVRLPEGSYNLELWFAENYFASAGLRKFDVFIEGEKVIEDLDLFAAAGYRTAHNLSFENVLVSDGTLDIHFSAEINNPLINGIIISQHPSSVDDEKEIPAGFGLNQNYPNPFNSGTVIKFNTGNEENVSFEIINLLGEKVYSQKVNSKADTEQEIKFDASALSSGVYLYMIKGRTNLAVKKMVLLK